jgi:ABC-type Fe3+-hydroxamate transport system substrate-binding protein
MSKKRMSLIIVLVFLLVSAGCGGNTQKATTPKDTAPGSQVSTSTNTDETVTVPTGPALPEPIDPVQPEQKIQMVYVTDTGVNYHRAGCKYLSKSKIALSLDEAKEEGSLHRL